MPDLAELVPDARVTQRRRREAEIARRANRPGLFGAVNDAINSEWASQWAFRQFQRSNFDYDPRFKLDQESLKAFTEGLPRDMWGAFSEAVSLSHAQRIRQQLLDVSEARTRLASLGWTGTGLRMAASVIDPTAIGFTIATAGAAGPAVFGARLTRMQRLIRGGLLAAGTEGSIEAYLASQDPERRAMDILWAGAGAFALGGGANVWVGSRLDKAARRMQKQIEFDEAVDAGLKVTDKGQMYFTDQIDVAKKRELVEALTSQLDLPADELAELRKLPPDEILGRVNTRVPDITYNGSDLNFRNVTDAKSAFGRMRFSMAGKLGQSKVPGVRRLASMLANDPLVKADGSVIPQAASEWVTLEHKVRLARFYRTANTEFKSWAAARSVTLTQRVAGREQFFEDIGLAIRQPRGEYTSNPHVNRVADLMRDEQKELLALAQRYGVKGFENIDELDTYLMRVHSQAKIDQAVVRFGQANVERLIAESMIRASEDLTAAQAAKIARGYLRIVRNLDEFTDVTKARIFSPDQSETLGRILRKEVPGISDSEVEDILMRAAPRVPERGVPGRARRRLDLDESHKIDVTDADGNLIGSLAITDLLENNAETLMHVYSRQILGHSAMSEVFRGMAKSPDDVIDSFDTIIARLRDEGRAEGLSASGMRRLESDLSKLETLHRAVVGLPLGRDTATADALRLMRSYQYIRVMNQVGFAQVAETGMILSNAGLRATLQQMPILRRIFSRARSGELTDAFLRELEAVLAVGTDRLRNQVVARFDAHNAVVEFSGGRFQRTLERGMRFTNDVSFMAPVNIVLQRYAAAAGIQRWANIAASGHIPSRARLASMGLTAKEARAITGQLKKHATMEPGLFGHRITETNVNKWDDEFAASKFVIAMDKWSRRVIQENDIGNLAQWMTTDLGRTIIQFRSFVAVAWEKQFLFNIQMHDWAAFTGLAWTMTFGGLAYIAQTYANSVGRSDRLEFLRERLSTSEIAAAAFQRSGYASFLPGVVDTGAQAVGLEQPFAYGRTQLSSWLNNPSWDFANGLIYRMPRAGLTALADDEEFTQRDARQFTRLLPYQNMLGVKNMVEALSSQLPEAE